MIRRLRKLLSPKCLPEILSERKKAQKKQIAHFDALSISISETGGSKSGTNKRN